ncbi:hypothetical protein ACQUWN_12360 [Rossellomorea aquimaris]|uniref:hypothetical protein n=1 Tax=Bacillaceae TaxID=186817 RepID=UPI0013B059F9|nr:MULTISPECIES: hypothetical protein [Bacillaceae]
MQEELIQKHYHLVSKSFKSIWEEVYLAVVTLLGDPGPMLIANHTGAGLYFLKEKVDKG